MGFRGKISGVAEVGCILFLLLICLGFFHKAGSEGVFYGADMELGRAWRIFAARAIKSGHLPLWNPYELSGYPFVAGMQSALFYPLNLIFLILPVDRAINFFILFHYFLGALFMCLFLKKIGAGGLGAVVGASVFMLSGFAVQRVISEGFLLVGTMAWLPLLFLLAEIGFRRRKVLWFVFAGVAYGIQILSGYVQFAYYSGLALGLYIIFRLVYGHFRQRLSIRGTLKHLGFCLVIFLVAVGLSAIQVLPTMELAAHSTRISESFQSLTEDSLPPENLLTFLLPEFFGNSVTRPYWGRATFTLIYAYIGILPLVLCFIGIFCLRNKNTYFFGALTILSLLLAMGRFTHIYRWFSLLIPGAGVFRIPGKFLLLTTFSLASLAGLGAGFLAKAAFSATLRRWLKIAFFSLIIIGAVGALGTVACLHPRFNFALNHHFEIQRALLKMLSHPEEAISADEWPFHYRSPNFNDPDFLADTYVGGLSAFYAFSLLLIASALPLGVAYRKSKSKGRIRQALLYGLILAIVLIDLFHFHSKYIITVKSNFCRWPGSIQKFLTSRPGHFRIATITRCEDEFQKGMELGLANIGGERPLILKPYQDFMNAVNEFPLERRSTYLRPERFSHLLSLVGVRYILVEDGFFGFRRFVSEPPLKPLLHIGGIQVFENPKVLPRVFIVHKAVYLPRAEAVLGGITRTDFQPQEVVLLVDKSITTDRGRLPQESYGGGVPSPPLIPHILSSSPNRVSLKVWLDSPGFLVLCDVFYPGWVAYVDGKKEEVLRADYILRAVEIDAGEHRVEFVFRPASFIIGAAISVITLSVLVVFFLAQGLARKS